MTRYALLFLCLLLPAVSGAGSNDHNRAKDLHDAGDIVSLEMLLEDVRSRHNGRILEIELEIKKGQIVYEIEMVDENGKVHEYFYDARDGRLLWEETDYSETEE